MKNHSSDQLEFLILSETYALWYKDEKQKENMVFSYNSFCKICNISALFFFLAFLRQFFIKKMMTYWSTVQGQIKNTGMTR